MSDVPIAMVNREAGSAGAQMRFAFGRNWLRFLKCVNEERIVEAEKSLREELEVESLSGMSFLDIGSGSGLFSLAAMRLGAAKVHSLDYDPQSVACAEELKQRYFPGAGQWTIQQGSVLDSDYVAGLGQFDVVYSWGVLHHTGNMWQAFEHVIGNVAAGGKLFIAIYNDQGRTSLVWRAVKRYYCRGVVWRLPIVTIFGMFFVLRGFIKDVFVVHSNPLRRYREYKQLRGMSFFPDMIDWLGGYPFEVAKPEEVFDFFRINGFELLRLKTVGGRHGNNEFVFKQRATG